MKLAWATDIHLDFCPEPLFERGFLPQLAGADAVLLTGDIANGRNIERWLITLSVKLDVPIYFVLGNHDYYHRSIAQVRESMLARCDREPNLTYLSDGSIIDLGGGTMLVGHDGWGDTRLGDFLSSTVELNDHQLIEELCIADRAELMPKLRALGDEAAASLHDSATRAIRRGARRLLVATHVPPYVESLWHEGKTAEPGSPWIPNFTCGATGATLRALAEAHPGVPITVFCGHTHGQGSARIRDNLVVHTGGADYGAPALAGWIHPERDEPLVRGDTPPAPQEQKSGFSLKRWLFG